MHALAKKLIEESSGQMMHVSKLVNVKLIEESSVQMLCALKVGRPFLQVDVDDKLYRAFL